MRVEPTVFIVDDDPEVLATLGELARIVFPQVQTYSSVESFLGKRNTPCECCGCVILDVAMPGMSGLELQVRLHEMGCELPIVFLTGYGNVQMAVAALQAGAVDFLEKPVREQDLWASIRRALEVDLQRRQRRCRRAEFRQRTARLTPGEHEVFDLILAGKYNKQIAARLGLSIRTVEDRRARVMRKMQADSVVDLVKMALLE